MRVVVNPHTVSTVFANVLLATVSGNAQIDFDVAAAAVAGYTQFGAISPLLMFCPPAGMDRHPAQLGAGPADPAEAQNFWGPGAFGLLDINFDANGPAAHPTRGLTLPLRRRGERSITRCFSAAASTSGLVRRRVRPSPG